MGAWAGPFLIAALLLAAAGVAKVVDPANAVGALRAFGVPVAPAVVRVVGAVEAALAVSAVVTGAAVLAVAVAASYLLFTGFVLMALVRDCPIGSCGCFGKVDTPPSVLHVVVNLGASWPLRSASRSRVTAPGSVTCSRTSRSPGSRSCC